jgi:hypothetical protein
MKIPSAPLATFALAASLLAAGLQGRLAAQSSPSPYAPPKLPVGQKLAGLKAPVTPVVTQPQPAPEGAVQRPGGGTGLVLANPEAGAAGGLVPSPQLQPPAAPVVVDGPQPHVFWEPGSDSKDFGDVVQGDALAHVFHLSNDGQGDLVISRIQPSCGCTVPTPKVYAEDGTSALYTFGEPIRPGQRIDVEAVFNTSSKQGQQRVSIGVFCNDPRQQVPLTLLANIKAVLALEPTALNLLSMLSTETKSGFLVVRSPLYPRFKLGTEGVLPPECKIELVPRDPDPQGWAAEWEMHATLGPNLAEGQRNYPVRLKVLEPVRESQGPQPAPPVLPGAAVDEHGHEPAPGAPGTPGGANASDPHALLTSNAVAYVVANVRGQVVAEPAYLSFSLIRPGQVASRSLSVECLDESFVLPPPTLSVKSFDGKDFKFKDYLSFQVRPITEGKRYDVELTITGLPESVQNEQFAGILVIETAHPSKPSMEVRFSGICRAAGTNAPATGEPLPGITVPNPRADKAGATPVPAGGPAGPSSGSGGG